MNKTKFTLLICAIVAAVAELGWGIYSLVNYFMLGAGKPLFYTVFYFIELAAQVAVIVLLTMAIWNRGKYFRQRYGLYMTALVISLIITLTSISCILLIVSIFVSDWVWEKPKEKAPNPHGFHTIEGEKGKPSKEDQIAQLRAMKENGLISEEQFQEEIMKLL